MLKKLVRMNFLYSWHQYQWSFLRYVYIQNGQHYLYKKQRKIICYQTHLYFYKKENTLPSVFQKWSPEKIFPRNQYIDEARYLRSVWCYFLLVGKECRFPLSKIDKGVHKLFSIYLWTSANATTAAQTIILFHCKRKSNFHVGVCKREKVYVVITSNFEKSYFFQ